MSLDTFNAESMKKDMQKALQQSNVPNPPVLSKLFELLRGVQEALREDNYTRAVLELRQGLQTNYGLRYTAYLRDEALTFENALFSVFIEGDHCAFQAEGQILSDLNAESMLDKAHDYLLRPYIVELMTGLLRQFGRSDRGTAQDIASATQLGVSFQEGEPNVSKHLEPPSSPRSSRSRRKP